MSRIYLQALEVKSLEVIYSQAYWRETPPNTIGGVFIGGIGPPPSHGGLVGSGGPWALDKNHSGVSFGRILRPWQTIRRPDARCELRGESRQSLTSRKGQKTWRETLLALGAPTVHRPSPPRPSTCLPVPGVIPGGGTVLDGGASRRRPGGVPATSDTR